jgi:hypothetical protein
MTRAPRPRQYLSRVKIALLRPLFRYSKPRNAYVLRIVGSTRGPVLCRDRRRRYRQWPGEERRELIIG